MNRSPSLNDGLDQELEDMLSREEGEQLAAGLEEVQAQLQHVSIVGGTSQVRHQVAVGSLPLPQPPSPPMGAGEVQAEEAR